MIGYDLTFSEYSLSFGEGSDSYGWSLRKYYDPVDRD